MGFPVNLKRVNSDYIVEIVLVILPGNGFFPITGVGLENNTESIPESQKSSPKSI